MFAHKLPPLITSATTDDLWTAPPPPSQPTMRKTRWCWYSSVVVRLHSQLLFTMKSLCICQTCKAIFWTVEFVFCHLCSAFFPSGVLSRWLFRPQALFNFDICKGPKKKSILSHFIPPPANRHTHTHSHTQTLCTLRSVRVSVYYVSTSCRLP